MFFQQRESGSLKLAMRNLESGKDVVLASHSGRCPRAGYLRVSPDHRLLAYQFTTGCNFIQPAKLYIIDLETKQRWFVEPDVFGVMHWTSDSKRLYFAKRESDQSPMFIHYVDVPEEDGDVTDESTADADGSKPAE